MYSFYLTLILLPPETHMYFAGVKNHLPLFDIKTEAAHNKRSPGPSIINVKAVVFHKASLIRIKTLS